MSNIEPKVVAIIEARMGSSRLPGKHLLEANGKPMLQHLIERIQRVSIIDEIVIATTTHQEDSLLVDFSKKHNVGSYQGSEKDVMGRVIQAAEKFSADIICEITGDCPIIDPEIVEQVVRTFLINSADYVNNGKYGGLPAGMNVQVFSLTALKRSADSTRDQKDREHVTLHIKRNPALFSSIYLIAPKKFQYPELQLTLDEKDDYELIKRIIEYFGDNDPVFGCEKIIRLLKRNSEWVTINENVDRKGER